MTNAYSSENRKNYDLTATPAIDEAKLPNPEALPELRLYSRSTIFYWWPIWLSGYVLALVTYLGGERLKLSNGTEILVHPNMGLGLTFIVLLTLIATITNLKLRGIYSVVALLVIAFITVLLGWLGWWNEIFSFIPQLTIFMNFGFYFVFSCLIFGIWLAQFLFFDKLVFWRIRPGQLTTERVIGGGEQSYDTRGMLFEQKSDDFFRHKLLGLGSADLLLITTGARKEEISIPNVLFADRKIKAMQRLIAIKPDEALSRTIH